MQGSAQDISIFTKWTAFKTEELFGGYQLRSGNHQALLKRLRVHKIQKNKNGNVQWKYSQH